MMQGDEAFINREVIGYAHATIDCADLKIGHFAKDALHGACDDLTAKRARDLHTFGQPRLASTGILKSPAFVGDMRARTLRRLMVMAGNVQLRMLEQIDERPHSFDHQEWANNPNGLRELGRFLIFVAAVNGEAAKVNRFVRAEDAAAIAHRRINAVDASLARAKLGLPRPR